MLIAHPDDEILFGYHDIYHNDVDIICFTSKNDPIRSVEFNECMNAIKKNGIMLDLPDSSIDTWKEYTNLYIIDTYIKPLLNMSYNMIISHDEKGEYGNLQHKRVNSIAKSLSKILKIEFMTFFSRFDMNDFTNNDFVEKRNKLLNIYKSQEIPVNAFRNTFYIKDKYKKFLCYRNL